MVSRPRRPICDSAGKVTAQLLLSFLAVYASPSVADIVPVRGSEAVLAGSPILSPLIPEPPEPAEHTFTLRHIFHHGTYEHPELHRRKDITEPEAEVWLAGDDGFAAERIRSLKAKSQSRRIERLVDRRPSVVDPMVAEARQRGAFFVSSPSSWTVDDIPGPNITDKETVLTMALIAADAYVEKPGMPDWEEVGKPFNKSEDFGWESDGLRGHIWGDESNSTVIIGLKGTSPAVFDGEGTTTNDKVNDNLFFSCCCAQQGQWSWHQVCDCATGTYQCNNTCVKEALHAENRYYQAARELYANVTELYPQSNIWVVGHSLGGAVSSLLGLTYGLPVVTFEAVPEALAAGRLGLPVPPNADPNYPQTREYTGAFHFGHTADPVYIGTCNGATASCSFAGYAMESACHTGYECAYDTVADKGWRVGIGTHKIRAVIKDYGRDDLVQQFYLIEDANQNCHMQNPWLVGLSRRNHDHGHGNHYYYKFVNFHVQDAWMQQLVYCLYDLRDAWLVRRLQGQDYHNLDVLTHRHAETASHHPSTVDDERTDGYTYRTAYDIVHQA
ncbi:hypothetical protein DL765_010083 [Monosporascus sp. GIB2]|nr:hypothetical protein DL765_010083 [Monosporascus sp. GIB2]